MGWSHNLFSSPSEVANAWCRKLPLLVWQASSLNSHCGVVSFNRTKRSLVANISRLPGRSIAISTPRTSASLILGECQDSELNEYCARKENELNFQQVRTLLIDNYDSYTYNIFQLLAVVNGVAPTVVKNDQLTWEYLHYILYEEHAFDNIVISPGPGSPTRAADIGICMQILHECTDIPILGVCLGHQALGYAHGAQVIHAPEPVHGRLSEIEHTGCQLFHGIPSGADSGFKVVRYHSLVLDADSLPEDLIPIAWTCSKLSDALAQSVDLDVISGRPGSQVAKDKLPSSLNKKEVNYADGLVLPVTNDAITGICKNIDAMKYAKVLMGVMHRNRPHYGVQFHPESIATSSGRKIFENFRNITVDHWLNLTSRVTKKNLLPCSFQKQLEGFESNVFMDLIYRAAKGPHTSNNLDLIDTDAKRRPTVLRLCWKRLEAIATKAGGSANIFCSLFGKGLAEDTFWLDSSTKDHGRARFSFMGGKGGLLWRRITFQLSDQSNGSVQDGGILSIEDENGAVRQTYLKNGFFDFLSKELQSFTCQKEEYEGLPFDFCGGFVGYIGYELKRECGMHKNRHKSHVPDACFFLADRLIAIDHCTDDVYILSVFPNVEPLDPLDKQNMSHRSAPTGISLNGSLRKQSHQELMKHDTLGSVYSHGDISAGCSLEPNNIEKGDRADSEAWMEAAEMRLLQLTEMAAKAAVERRKSPFVSISEGVDNQQEAFTLQKSKNQYMEDVSKCLQYIKDGESYELCLTTQMRKRMRAIDTLCLYLNLREENPAPYAAWLHFGKEDICICSSSPERFLRLDQDDILEAKPIKGTIPRGSSQIEDEKLRSQLQHSEKDQAENLMIVDLLRNDLGRVCKPGTVHVPSLMDVESYATVHTLVSTIRGEKKENVTAVDCVRAAFPGGSMTGAPKLRAMEILDSIENSSRGVYSGTIGFFSFNHTFDLNIVIRTIVVHAKEASIGAGGAIVALSDREDEYEEMILKARAPINAVTEFEKQSNLYSIRGQNGCVAPLQT